MPGDHKISEVTTADLIARFLVSRAIKRIYSLSGGHILPIWDALYRSGIEIIDVRDERAAVHMAQAEAELCGSCAVAVVTAGPGVTNASTGIANAAVSQIPLLIIGGAVPQPQCYRNGFQDLPHIDLLRPITNYARTIRRPDQVLRELDRAWSSACSELAACGPSYIEFPADLLRQLIQPTDIEKNYFKPATIHFLYPDERAVLEASKVLAKAEKPVLITGRGAVGRSSSIDRFLTTYPAAYLDTMQSRGVLPADHPMFMPAARSRIMNEADLVITVGCRLDFQLGFGSKAVFPNAQFVRIGSNSGDLTEGQRGVAELAGEPANCLDLLTERMSGAKLMTDSSWLNSLQDYEKTKRLALSDLMYSNRIANDGLIHPFGLLLAVRSIIQPDTILVLDGGDILSFGRVALQSDACLNPGPLGTIGVGLPYATAASIIFPDRQVILITGDGSLGFNLAELDTLVRHRAKLLVIVSNNASWNIEMYDQKTTYGGRVVGTQLQATDYSAVARAFGMYGEQVERIDQLDEAIQRGMENMPALINVVVSREAISPDSKAGLAWVPDRHALAQWDAREKQLIDGSENT